MHDYVAVTEPFLSDLNKQKRMKWALTHESWTEAQWETVVFSDETSVTVRPKSPKKRVWRMKRERYKTFNLVPSFKSGYVGISVWAAFSTRGRTPLVIMEGTLKKKQYQSI